MKEKINIENPGLKENPFTVPLEYFETFPKSVSDRVFTPIVIRFKRTYIIVTSVAAALVLVFGTLSLTYYGEKNLNSLNQEYASAEKEAISGNLTNFSSEDIIDYLTYDDIDVTTLSLVD